MATASLKANYDTNKGNRGGAGTISFNGGDVNLRLSATEATLVPTGGLSSNGLSLSLDKPGSFSIHYDVPTKDIRFQFMSSARVFDKLLNLTYSHSRGGNRTALDGTLVLGSSNQLSATYDFDGYRNAKLKYSYMIRGLATLEPSYDFGRKSWGLAISQGINDDGDLFRASYQTSSNVLGLDYMKNSVSNGSFKVSASLNLADELKIPKISCESIWNFEMSKLCDCIKSENKTIRTKEENMKTKISELKPVPEPMQTRSLAGGGISRSVQQWFRRFRGLPEDDNQPKTKSVGSKDGKQNRPEHRSSAHTFRPSS